MTFSRFSMRQSPVSAHLIDVVGRVSLGSSIFRHPMRLCICLGFILVTCVYGDQPPYYGNNVPLVSKENDGIRLKRMVIVQTAYASPKRSAVQTKRTEIISSVVRKFLSLEVKWFYAMARKSKAEVIVFLVLGITFTFVVIFSALALIAKLLVPPLPILKRRQIRDAHQPDLNFPLPYWMNKIESWDGYVRI